MLSPAPQLAYDVNNAVFLLSPEGQFVAVNAKFAELTGRPAAELLGQSTESVWPGTLAQTRERIAQAIRQGALGPYELEVATPVGQKVLSVNAFTLYGELPIGVMHIVSGNTRHREAEAAVMQLTTELQQSNEELRVAEEALRQQNEELAAARHVVEAERQRYQELFDLAPDGYLVTDAIGTIQEANRAAATLLHVPQNFLVGKPLSLYIADAERTSFRLQLSRLLAAQEGEEWEVRMQPREGTPFAAALTVAAVCDPNGKVVSLRWLLRDISVRKRAEETLARHMVELQRSNEDLQQFVYAASHDLQEPLRQVASFVQLLARRYQGQLDAQADEFIGYAVEGATRLQRLIHDLLVYSQIGWGQEFAATDCEAVLTRTLRALQIAIEESGAVVTHDPLPTVWGDAVQLGHVLQNLIGNALKFRGEAPPRIHLSARPEEGQWMFSVRDNGIGLEPQYAERIFLLFQRLHTRAQYQGTGIGLAVCKKVIERHGGRIWVESEPGQGTTFFFTIPIP
jgi:PAS domain S-box-containing protein